VKDTHVLLLESSMADDSVTTKTTKDGWVVVSLEDKTKREAMSGGPIIGGGGGIQMLSEQDAANPENPDDCPVMELLIQQEKAELREVERQREEEERFKQEIIDTAKAVGTAGVAVGGAAVGAVAAVGNEVVREGQIAGKFAAEAVVMGHETLKSAAGEVAVVANKFGEMAGDMVIQNLAPTDLLGMYGALEKFLEVLMTYVVHGVPLAKIPPIDVYTKALKAQYKTSSGAVQALISGAEDSALQILADGLVQTIPGGAIVLIAKKYFVELRLIACVASIYGHDCTKPETQSQMLWALVPGGSSGNDANESSVVATLSAVRQQVARALVGQVLKQVGLGQVRTVGAAFETCGRLWTKRQQEQALDTTDVDKDEGVSEKVIKAAERIFNPHWSPVSLPLLNLTLALPTSFTGAKAAEDTPGDVSDKHGEKKETADGNGKPKESSNDSICPKSSPWQYHLQYMVPVTAANCRYVCGSLLLLQLLPPLLSALGIIFSADGGLFRFVAYCFGITLPNPSSTAGIDAIEGAARVGSTLGLGLVRIVTLGIGGALLGAVALLAKVLARVSSQHPRLTSTCVFGIHALLPTIGSFTAVAGVFGGVYAGSLFTILSGLHSGVSSLLYLSQNTSVTAEADGTEEGEQQKKQKRMQKQASADLEVKDKMKTTTDMPYALVAATLAWSDLLVACGICKRSFHQECDGEYNQEEATEITNSDKMPEEKKEEEEKTNDNDNTNGKKKNAEPTTAAAKTTASVTQVTAQELALEQVHLKRLRDTIWHATLIWVAAEEIVLHWLLGYTTHEGAGLRLLVAASKLLAMWGQHSLLQLIRQREVVLWLVGAENALVGAMSAIGAAISWSVARHAEQMPLWLDSLLPHPYAVCSILGIRRRAVVLGLVLGLLKASSRPSLLGVGVLGAVVVVAVHARGVWNKHKNELGCEEKSKGGNDANGDNSKPAHYDGRLRMLLPSVSQAAEKALMATVAKMKATVANLPQNAAMNMTQKAVQSMAVTQMQSFAQEYVTGKLKGE